MPKNGGQIPPAAITLVKPSSLALGVVPWQTGLQIRSPGSSLEHLQLTKLFLELSNLGSWCGCSSFKEKVKLSPYCPQR